MSTTYSTTWIFDDGRTIAVELTSELTLRRCRIQRAVHQPDKFQTITNTGTVRQHDARKQAIAFAQRYMRDGEEYGE